MCCVYNSVNYTQETSPKNYENVWGATGPLIYATVNSNFVSWLCSLISVLPGNVHTCLGWGGILDFWLCAILSPLRQRQIVKKKHFMSIISNTVVVILRLTYSQLTLSLYCFATLQQLSEQSTWILFRYLLPTVLSSSFILWGCCAIDEQYAHIVFWRCGRTKCLEQCTSREQSLFVHWPVFSVTLYCFLDHLLTFFV